MSYRLMRIKTSGMKNIESEICLKFANDTLPKKDGVKGSNVKAVYGLNGAGKSAIMSAVDLSSSIIKNDDFISKRQPLFFDNMINKKTKSFDFEYTFSVFSDKDGAFISAYIYKQAIKYKESKWLLTSESLDKVADKTVNGKKVNIFSTDNGVLSLSDEFPEDLANQLKTKTLNLLDKSSFSSLYLSILIQYLAGSSNKAAQDWPDYLMDLLHLAFFANSIYVSVDSSDRHENYVDQSAFIDFLSHKDPNSLIKSLLEFYQKPEINQEQTILKEDYKKYEEQIDKLCLFIKVFKPDLQKIEISKKEDDRYYHCRKIFKYKDYSVDEEFESTGIKKLVSLFAMFERVSEGKIVFIDELDANIHDVYLCKLLDYFSKYCEGQLCFTTHNIGPMKYMAKWRYSLDFLGSNNKLVPWIKNGHYEPEKLYSKGMIQYSPFNFEPFDFLSIFGGDEKCN